MQYRQLGRAGLRISAFALGTANLGSVTDETESHRILDEAVDAGVNLLDTANSYNREQESTCTESILGRWFAHSPRRRQQVVLATKVYSTVGDGPNDAGLSALHIRQACEDSLRRLRTDHIDLYQMHHVDRSTSWEEIWQAMDQLVREGKVIYVGSSNFAAWQIALAQCVALRGYGLGFVSEQSVYNLTNRAVELEVIPACDSLGLAFLAYSPLGGGMLSGDELRAGHGGQRARLHSMSESNRKEKFVVSQFVEFEVFCRELGHTTTHVALAWLLHRQGVCATILGPRTVEQLRSCLEATTLELSDETIMRLDSIWPGPGGEAPEAYAW